VCGRDLEGVKRKRKEGTRLGNVWRVGRRSVGGYSLNERVRRGKQYYWGRFVSHGRKTGKKSGRARENSTRLESLPSQQESGERKRERPKKTDKKPGMQQPMGHRKSAVARGDHLTPRGTICETPVKKRGLG